MPSRSLFFRMTMFYFRGRYRLRLFITFAFILSMLLIANWAHLRHKSMDWRVDKEHFPRWQTDNPTCLTLKPESMFKSNFTTFSLPTKEKMDSMSHSELVDIYHNFMNTITFHCKNIVRVGTLGDGGWNVCADPEYIPKEPCFAYSFGIGTDSSFDLEVHKKFNCEVHSFDPTLNDAQIKKISPLLNFHSIGLCDQDIIVANRSYKTLYEIRRTFGHLQTELAILKLDIEMWEWRSLGHSIPNNMLDDVRQLLVEFHLFNINQDWRWNQYHSSLGLLRDLQDLGFRAFSVQRNEFCSFLTENNVNRTTCHNIQFVKIT